MNSRPSAPWRLSLGLFLALAPLVHAQPNVPAAPEASTPEGTVSFKSRTFEQRKEFATDVRNAVIKLDGQLAELGKETEAAKNPDRAQAIDEAKSARILLENQLGKVDQASTANWETVRDSVLDALARVQAASAKAANAVPPR